MTSSTSTKSCRVWVVGGHATGKSVLSRWIARRYNLPRFDEVARSEIAKMGANSFDTLRTDLDAVTQFQRNVFTTQVDVGKGLDRFVSDRAFDNLAYACEQADFGTTADLWESAECRRYVGRACTRRSLGPYAKAVDANEGVVFFVRPGVVPVADGTRATSDLDVAGIYRIDGAIKLLLELGRVRYVPIQTTVFQERASIVSGVLRYLT